jgi:hypothetical protein
LRVSQLEKEVRPNNQMFVVSSCFIFRVLFFFEDKHTGPSMLAAFFVVVP